MLFDSHPDHIQASLAADIARAYASCTGGDLLPAGELRRLSRAYMESLLARVGESEFLDTDTAARVAKGCELLLDYLESDPREQVHHCVQAAVRYFVLEDDAEGDDSIVGFDDDWAVVVETAKALKIELEV